MCANFVKVRVRAKEEIEALLEEGVINDVVGNDM